MGSPTTNVSPAAPRSAYSAIPDLAAIDRNPRPEGRRGRLLKRKTAGDCPTCVIHEVAAVPERNDAVPDECDDVALHRVR